MRLSHSQSAGMTLVESSIASTIAAFFLSSVFAINISSMQTVKRAREAAAASQVLQQRIESLRIANWHQVTDANFLKSDAKQLGADAPGSEALKGISEQLTLVPYGSSAIGNTQIVRSNGVATIINNNQTLLAENAIKVIWTLTYTGNPNDQTMTRQVVAILAKGGVAKW
jgi:type II secretory pathway pseudopilin PulG